MLGFLVDNIMKKICQGVLLLTIILDTASGAKDGKLLDLFLTFIQTFRFVSITILFDYIPTVGEKKQLFYNVE